MYKNIFSVAFFITLVRLAFAADDFVFHTPELTQCKEAKFEWEGGNAAYAVYVLPFNDPCGDAVAEVGVTPNNFKKWNVTIPAGSKVQILVEDSEAAEAWTGIITVNDSDDKSCISDSAVKVLSAAGALPSTAASSATASSVASASTTLSASISGIYGGVATGAAAVGNAPPVASPAVPSGSIASGIANAANPAQSNLATSGAMSVVAPTASIVGLATFLFAIFQL